MRCAWKELLAILPVHLRGEVDRLGKEGMQELRLRINSPPELVLTGKRQWLSGSSTKEDLNFVINAASKYSPWRASTVAQGYITAPGGHRIGLCGEAICRNGIFEGIREPTSLCIRVARDYPGIANLAEGINGSILILGAPGWGKTTLLRDLIRLVCQKQHVAVLDERNELFPEGFTRGRGMDVMLGCPKHQGIGLLLRTMGPECIAVDEITEEEDCSALVQAANCGVRLLASAHASGMVDFRQRRVYRKLVENRIFDALLILRQDKSCYVERMML